MPNVPDGLKSNAAVWYGGRSGGNNSVVECDLAKVEVAGSNPVSRSIFLPSELAREYGASEGGRVVSGAPSPRGKAEVCKTSTPGSNPGGASNFTEDLPSCETACLAVSGSIVSLCSVEPTPRQVLLAIQIGIEYVVRFWNRDGRIAGCRPRTAGFPHSGCIVT